MSPTSNKGLRYETLGSGGDLLLMHGGMGLDHTLFRPWLDPLAQDARLIYYDHMGNGGSELPRDWAEVTHASWADDASHLLDELGSEQAVVLGHSYGSFLACEFALRHPQRTLGLVLVAGTPVLDYGAELVAQLQGHPDPVVAATAVRMLTEPAADDEHLREDLSTIWPLYFASPDPERDRALLENARIGASAFNHANAHCLPVTDLRDRLGALSVPVLVVSGRSDFIMPPEQAGARLAAAIAGATHRVFERSGHFPFVEEQASFLEVVRAFLPLCHQATEARG